MSDNYNGGNLPRRYNGYEEILTSLFHKPFDFLALAGQALHQWDEHEPYLRHTRMLASEALVMAVGWLLGDAPRVWAETIGRPWPDAAFPAWLLLLDEAEISEAKRIPEVSVGTCYLAGVELAGGHRGTLVIVIDHQQGDAVVYAICTDVELADVERVFAEVLGTSPTTNLPMRPAHVKVVLTQAIAHTTDETTVVGTEHNQWPVIRPLLELALDRFHWPN